MTLAEFSNMCFKTPSVPETYTIFVFEDEGSADSWLEDRLENGDNRDAIVSMTIHGDAKIENYVKPEVCNRKVEMVFAVARDIFAIVIGDENG